MSILFSLHFRLLAKGNCVLFAHSCTLVLADLRLLSRGSGPGKRSLVSLDFLFDFLSYNGTMQGDDPKAKAKAQAKAQGKPAAPPPAPPGPTVTG